MAIQQDQASVNVVPDRPQAPAETYYADFKNEKYKIRLFVSWQGDAWESALYDFALKQHVWKQSYGIGSQAQHELIRAAAAYVGTSLGEMKFNRSI